MLLNWYTIKLIFCENILALYYFKRNHDHFLAFIYTRKKSNLL